MILLFVALGFGVWSGRALIISGVHADAFLYHQPTRAFLAVFFGVEIKTQKHNGRFTVGRRRFNNNANMTRE